MYKYKYEWSWYIWPADGNIHRGIECLEKCPVDLFQPYNIFLLFPEHMISYIQENELKFLPEFTSIVAFEETHGQRTEVESKGREHILDYLFRVCFIQIL